MYVDFNAFHAGLKFRIFLNSFDVVPTPTHQLLPPDLGGGDGNPRDVVGGQCGHTLKLGVDYSGPGLRRNITLEEFEGGG